MYNHISLLSHSDKSSCSKVIVKICIYFQVSLHSACNLQFLFLWLFLMNACDCQGIDLY